MFFAKIYRVNCKKCVLGNQWNINSAILKTHEKGGQNLSTLEINIFKSGCIKEK